MLASLDPVPPTRRALAARRVATAATLAMVLVALAFVVPLAVDDPQGHRAWPVASVEEGDDYVAWSAVTGFPGAHAFVRYTTNGTPDRVLLLRGGDLPALLRGEPVEPLHAFGDAKPFAGHASGEAAFPVPSQRCPPPTGACDPDDLPLLVWVRGDAWRGASVEDARWDVVEHQHLGAVGWNGPVGFGLSVVGARVWNGLLWAGPTAAALGVVALVATAAWAVLERRLRLAAPESPRLVLPEGSGVESMLGVVRLASLYVESIVRSFLLGAFVIALSALSYFAFALPAVVDLAKRQFEFGDPAPAVALFVFVPLVALVVALTFWAASYLRVRRELTRWRDLSARFEEDAGRILGA